MGLDRPRRGYASSSKPRVAATMDYGDAKDYAVISNLQEANPNSSDNVWQRQAQEEMGAMLQKEKEYRKNLHGRYLQKAAANAQNAFESRKRLMMLRTGGGQVDAPLQSTARPVIWGSALYQGLWAKAAKIP